MAMLKDEITVVKSVMMNLDTDTAMLVTYQYHVEADPSDPAGKKKDRSKSKYRYLARVFKTDDLVKKINELHDEKNRLNKFKWPDDTWPWYICAGYSDNWKVADWLATKLKNIKTWEEGQKILSGWQSGTKTRLAGINEKAKYEVDGYLDNDGNQVSLTDLDTLKKLVGKNLMKVDKKQANA